MASGHEICAEDALLGLNDASEPGTSQGSTLTFLPTCPFGQVTMIITCPKTNFACPKSFSKEGSKVVSFFYFLCDMFHPH